MPQKALDIPKLYMDAPRGSSLFQTPTEIAETVKNHDRIVQKYNDTILRYKSSKLGQNLVSWATDDKKLSKKQIAEPKPKKDTHFCGIWNDDYKSFRSHIATNQHRLRSYSDSLASFYDKIDCINTELQEQMINDIESISSPKVEKYEEIPEKSSKEGSSLDDRLQNLNQLVNNILYRDVKPFEKGR